MKHTLFLVTMTVVSCFEISAQLPISITDTTISQEERLKRDHHIVFTTSDALTADSDSVRSMIDLFYVDQFRHFQDPRAPYFLFMSKDANLAMGIGGVVRMRAWADWNGSIPANGFVPYLIPVPKDPAQQKKLSATPAGTALFFKVIGRNSGVGDYLAYIECNFDGYNNVGFKLKKAYVTINDITVGYSLTTFSDPIANPPTIDGAGPNGEINRSAVMVRWFHNFNNNWSVATSLEIPKSNAATDNINTQSISDWTPDIITFGQYQWDNSNQHIRLSGLLRQLPYRNLVTKKDCNKLGWALQLSSIFKPFSPLTIYTSINYGEGYGSYTNDLQISNYDLIEMPDKRGEMYAPRSIGVTAGLKYNFRENIYACLALGEMRYLPQHRVNSNEYKYGLYGAANLFWDINPRLQVGVEYLIGKRKNYNGESGMANRADAVVQFSF